MKSSVGKGKINISIIFITLLRGAVKISHKQMSVLIKIVLPEISLIQSPDIPIA